MTDEEIKKERILEILKEFGELSTHAIIKHYADKFGKKSKGSLGIAEKRGLQWHETKLYLFMLVQENKISVSGDNQQIWRHQDNLYFLNSKRKKWGLK